eukprot:6276589-Amphidinium_carterae.1
MSEPKKPPEGIEQKGNAPKPESPRRYQQVFEVAMEKGQKRQKRETTDVKHCELRTPLPCLGRTSQGPQSPPKEVLKNVLTPQPPKPQMSKRCLKKIKGRFLGDVFESWGFVPGVGGSLVVKKRPLCALCAYEDPVTKHALMRGVCEGRSHLPLGTAQRSLLDAIEALQREQKKSEF